MYTKSAGKKWCRYSLIYFQNKVLSYIFMLKCSTFFKIIVLFDIIINILIIGKHLSFKQDFFKILTL